MELTRQVPATAGEVLRQPVLHVDATRTVAQVWEAMQHACVEHAVVVSGGTSLGVLTLSEIWVAWSLELAPVASRPVLPLVVPAPTVSVTTELPELCRVLLRSRSRAALVRDGRGTLIGLVTADDVLALMAEERVLAEV